MMRCELALLLCFFLPAVVFGQPEICDNGIDDDADGLIDLNDPDCRCEIIAPVSVIPNPSFEEQECCPSNRSQLNCAARWIQASEPTTDYIHTCNWLGWDDFPPPRPFPDGEGIMGFRDGRVRNGGGGGGGSREPEPYWKEYAGACLLSPLRAGTTYRFQFDIGFVDAQKSPPINVSFFGTASCDNLPFGSGDDAFGCPTNDPGWRKLGQVNASGGNGNVWVNTFIEVVPDEDIYAIAIGPDCGPVSSPVSIYYYFDNLLLDNLESFNFRITPVRHPCAADFTLSIPSRPGFTYQWYRAGVALLGETSPELTRIYGEGTYQVRVLDGASCRLSGEFDYVVPRFTEAPRVVICEGEAYELGGRQLTVAGTYADTLKTRENCDSIVALELAVIGTAYDSLEVSIVAGSTFTLEGREFQRPGDYPLTLTSSLGCDSLVLLRLDNFPVYIPNAFSPNYDGMNDEFAPFAPRREVTAVHLRIFDRWGGLVHEGTSWDGADYPAGVYLYVIRMDFDHGISQTFSGSVTLLR